jgi:NADP-dependent 3-hydroxy acid dehydrogenase YdfG
VVAARRIRLSKKETLDIVIVGGSRDLGRALAVALTPFSASLTLLGRSAAGLRKTARLSGNGSCHLAAFDLSDMVAVEGFLRRFRRKVSKIDTLLLVAGPDYIGRLNTASMRTIRYVCDSYVRGLMLLTKGMLPLLRAARRSHVMFFSAHWNVPKCGCEAGSAVFLAAKGALEAFVDGLASEEWRNGVTVSKFFLGELADGQDNSSGQNQAIVYEDVAVFVRLALLSRTLRVESMLIMPRDPGAGRGRLQYQGAARDL